MSPPGPGRFGLLDGFGRRRRSRPPSASPDIRPRSSRDRRASGKCSTKAGWLPALRDACLGRFPSSVGDHSCFEKVSDQSQHTSIADLIADQINKPILKANSRERQVRTRRSAGESRIRTVGTASQDQGLKIRRMRMPPSKRLTASA